MKLKKTILILAMMALAAAPLAQAQSPAGGKTDKAAIEAKIKESGELWSKAIMQKDPTVLDPIIADDFVGTNSKGKVSSKKEMYAAMKADTDSYTSASDSNVKVHVFSDDVAVATGSSTEKGKSKDGKEFTRGYHWTDTWLQRDGKWQIISSQSAQTSGEDDDDDDDK
jgi:ketosteroid isomerase-like protein